MKLLEVRDILSFPSGANASDTFIDGAHFNLTTLDYWNYTWYEGNGTVSNGSNCYILLNNIVPPLLLPNGTFINGTWCWNPYYPIRKRGSLGIAFASAFALSIMFTLVNLNKHGRLHLPNTKRFHAIGRRWQWYWMLFVAGCGIISGVSAVDVDRDYLQNIPIILENFFFYLMVPGILATVWEGVRHWGSWQERQIYDRDPFSLPQNDRRAKKEFYMPLVFYLFAWLNFFMNIPRNWGGIQSQGDPTQIITIAEPSATDLRFKVGGILAFAAWCMICSHLHHSIHYYTPVTHGPIRTFIGFLRHTPVRFLFTIPLLFIVVAYNIASAWFWSINIANMKVYDGWVYGAGYGPVLLILLINELEGLRLPNEDREIIRQRVERGQATDAELGISVKKPAWWDLTGGHQRKSPEQQLKDLASEVGGGRATARNIGRNIELGIIPPRPRMEEDDDERNPFRNPENPFKDDVEGSTIAETATLGGNTEDERISRIAWLTGDSEPGENTGERSTGPRRGLSRDSTGSTLGRPQVVKSMLDV